MNNWIGTLLFTATEHLIKCKDWQHKHIGLKLDNCCHNNNDNYNI